MFSLLFRAANAHDNLLFFLSFTSINPYLILKHFQLWKTCDAMFLLIQNKSAREQAF